eukprot:TRINITY_DN30312_c0_g1_i1.p1 TRINITY_DN30312_c0_g1~~TRINITY_DN30312_c0_g1_i1.p1  ORF type:complete len:218 (+),score=51.67 TRINITY_DN30312_c0_g1_i1:87-740(+)
MASPDDTVEEALTKLSSTFKQDENAATYAKLTEHVLSLLRAGADSRAQAVEQLVALQDQLHLARRTGNYVKEANLIEAMAGRMRSDDSYGLKSVVPVVQQEQSADFQEMMKMMQKAQLESRPYEFINEADTEEMTVNIKVPPETQMKDVTVKLTAKTIRVEVKGHELQPCVLDGSFYKAVDVSGCDHHLEGSGDKRVLCLDLFKAQNGMKWPDILAF